MKAVLVSTLALATFASPAFAGPIGSGLFHTEAVARKGQVVIRHADTGCLSDAAAVVGKWPGVKDVKVNKGELRLSFSRPDHAAAAETDVRSTVRAACAQPARAGAEPSESAPDRGA